MYRLTLVIASMDSAPHTPQAELVIDREKAAALGVTREHGQRSYEAWSLKVMADTAVGAGPAPAVETQYRAALALAEELGMRPLAAHCHLGLGELYRGSRQWRRAREHVRRAADCYGALDMRFWLDRVEPVA